MTCIKAENRVDLRIESTAELILEELKNGGIPICKFGVTLKFQVKPRQICSVGASKCISVRAGGYEWYPFHENSLDIII